MAVAGTEKKSLINPSFVSGKWKPSCLHPCIGALEKRAICRKLYCSIALPALFAYSE